jgi:uncharacterized membrane protein YhaH (DUF805 family)
MRSNSSSSCSTSFFFFFFFFFSVFVVAVFMPVIYLAIIDRSIDRSRSMMPSFLSRCVVVVVR